MDETLVRDKLLYFLWLNVSKTYANVNLGLIVKNLIQHFFSLGAFLFFGVAFAQSGQPNPGRDATVQLAKEFAQEYSNNSEYAPIRSKIPVTTKLATLEQLANNSKPTNEEKKALEAYAQLRKKYDDKDLAILNQYYSYIVPVRRIYYREIENAISDLYVGKITFGQFNKKRKEISDDFQSKVDVLNSERRANRQAAQQSAQKNAQKEATCNKLRAQLQERMNAQNGFLSGLADAAAWDPGFRNSTTASLSARAAQKAQEQEQINQMQQNIINFCGSL